MSVMNIFEHSQFGELVRYRDFVPQPPANDVEAFGASSFLIYPADDRQDAERWLEESRYINARLEDVGADEICADHVEGRAA